MSFYVDMVFTVIIGLVAKYANESKEALVVLTQNVFSIFFHGLAHLYIATAGEKYWDEELFRSKDIKEFTKRGCMLYLFWFVFMKTVLGKTSNIK